MLVFTTDQIAALGDIQRRRFLDRLEAVAREEAPAIAAALGDQTLRTALDAAVRRAEGFGVSERDPIERVVLMALESGGAMWDPPEGWGLDILMDDSLTGRSKALALEWRAHARSRGGDG